MSVGVGERVRSAGRHHSGSVDRVIDTYLSENMPDLVDKYKLANKNDILDIDRRISSYESDINDLETWKDETTNKLGHIKNKVQVLEKKYGIE